MIPPLLPQGLEEGDDGDDVEVVDAHEETGDSEQQGAQKDPSSRWDEHEDDEQEDQTSKTSSRPPSATNEDGVYLGDVQPIRPVVLC